MKAYYIMLSFFLLSAHTDSFEATGLVSVTTDQKSGKSSSPMFSEFEKNKNYSFSSVDI